MNVNRRTVYISADCNGTGLEVKADDGPLVMTDPAALGLSPPLRRDLHNWQRWFDGVFGLFDPAERYAALGDRFDEVGRRLAERVAEELGPGCQVVYEPQGGWRLAHQAAPVPIAVASPAPEPPASSPCQAPQGYWDESDGAPPAK